MEDSINNIEDQPLPQPDPETNAAFQASVDELGRQLMRKFQLNGNQFNALELELRLMVLVEQVNVVTKIIQTISGAYSDAELTVTMTKQVAQMAKAMQDALAAAPRIVAPAGGPGPRLNGSKQHN